jgi:hypothetical protein
MTAVAPSVAPKVDEELTNTILRLPEKDFWDLVDIRLNRPKKVQIIRQQDGQNQAVITDANEHIEYLTEERLIDELFLQLAFTKQTICHNGKNMIVYKYYRQALALRNWIPIAKPSPAFVVNISDLCARMVAELKTLDDPPIVLKQAVGRIFENIDARQYHLSIASKLKVRLSK